LEDAGIVAEHHEVNRMTAECQLLQAIDSLLKTDDPHARARADLADQFVRALLAINPAAGPPHTWWKRAETSENLAEVLDEMAGVPPLQEANIRCLLRRHKLQEGLPGIWRAYRQPVGYALCAFNPHTWKWFVRTTGKPVSGKTPREAIAAAYRDNCIVRIPYSADVEEHIRALKEQAGLL